MSNTDNTELAPTPRLNFGVKPEDQMTQVPKIPEDDESTVFASSLMDDLDEATAHQYERETVEAPSDETEDNYETIAQEEIMETEAEQVPEATVESTVAETQEAGLNVVDAVAETAETQMAEADSGVYATADAANVQSAEVEAPVTSEEVAAEFSSDSSEPSVVELREKQADLERQIKARQDAEKQTVLAQIKNVVTNYNLTAEEVVEALGGLKNKRKGVKAKAKYQDPATGAVWSGRGKAPNWIKDKDRTQYLIVDEAAAA